MDTLHPCISPNYDANYDASLFPNAFSLVRLSFMRWSLVHFSARHYTSIIVRCVHGRVFAKGPKSLDNRFGCSHSEWTTVFDSIAFIRI